MMRKAMLAAVFLTLMLLGASILGSTLGAAHSVQIDKTPRPSPTPDGLAPDTSPASPETPILPDLIVEDVWVSPATPLIGEEATIYVVIKNQGPLDVPLDPPQNFYTDLYVDPAIVPIQLFQAGVYAWGCQAHWVPSGGSYLLQTTYVFTSVKNYVLYAQIDTDAQVPEQNESNNVFGPFQVEVRAPNRVQHQTHTDFQMGVASSLDISHPDGVIRRGIFLEPFTEPEVYYPDWKVDDPPAPPSHPNNVNQVKPALTGNGSGTLYAVWEDGRNGGVFDRDIYFSRSTDGGMTWTSPDVRVNDDSTSDTANQVSPDIAYDESRDRIYAVWQDARNGDYDIYFAYSDDNGDNWSANELLSIDPPTSLGADQMNPSIAVGPNVTDVWPVAVYVVWQDRRNGNDDIYISRSDDGGLTWTDNIFVTDDPQMTSQDQVAPSVGVGYDLLGYDDVFVAWEDWRDPANPEIYVARSRDRGGTFGIDVPVDNNPHNEGYRVGPSMIVSTTAETVQVDVGFTKTVESPVTAIHVAWQENAGEEADVYYTYATYVYEEPEFCPYPYDFCFEGPSEASGFVIDSNYALPPDTGPTYPIDPTWQGQVSLAKAFDTDYTYCHADSIMTYTMGVFLAWSDARSFDDWRYEIRTRRVASPEGTGESYELCEDQVVGVVNDTAKIHAYREQSGFVDSSDYEIFRPAATGQFNPYVFAEPPPFPSFSPRLYVTWDDDRWDVPLEPGTVRDRDIFAARWGLYPEGIYISPVIDSRAASSWYVLSWWGTTQYAGDLLLQTRFGNNPNPPLNDVAANGWTEWTGNPSSEVVDCPGANCFYDAPGRHIVDPNGNSWVLECQEPGCPGPGCPNPDCPDAYQYIQYKVIIRSYSRHTTLSQVTIHYAGPNVIYLPIVVNND